MIRILILGGGHAGVTLARKLDDFGEVVVLDPDPAVVERAERAGVAAHEADVTSARALERYGIDATDLAIVASGDDGANLLTAQLLRVQFDAERIVVLVNDPRNVDSFADRVETVCATSAVADALGDRFDLDEQSRDTASKFA